MPAFNPNDYTTVAERLTRAADQLQTIIAEPPVMLNDVMGYIRCTVALKDGRTSTGTASFRLDLTGGRAQATNPIEDCETSAIGRALGMLGYGSKNGIASQEEIHEAERRRARTEYIPTQDVPEPPATTGGQKASDKQIKMLFAIWKKQNYAGTLQAWIETNYKCTVNDLSMKDASAAIEKLDQPVEA